MAIAAALMVACVVLKANQYSSGSECPSNDEPLQVVSLLQTKFQMRVVAEKEAAQRGVLAEESLIPLIPIPEEEQKADEEAAASLAASAGKAAAEKGAKEATAEKASPDPGKDAAQEEATAEKASPDPEKDAAEEATAEMASPDPEKDAAEEAEPDLVAEEEGKEEEDEGVGRVEG